MTEPLTRKDFLKMLKTYIGDGVYVEHDGYGLVLTTEDGISVTNRIVLESSVYESLLIYVENLRAAAEHESEDPHDGDEDLA